MSVLKKGKLNIWEDLECAIHAAPLWPDIHDLKTNLLLDSKKDVVEIEIKVFDIPLLHDMTTDEGKKFNKALAAAKNLDVFSSFYIQTLIDYKWPLVRFYTVLLLFIPFQLQLIVFTCYSNFLTG